MIIAPNGKWFVFNGLFVKRIRKTFCSGEFTYEASAYFIQDERIFRRIVFKTNDGDFRKYIYSPVEMEFETVDMSKLPIQYD